MSYRHDLAREKRHQQQGGARLTARISAEANRALDALCRAHQLRRNQALEYLLTGALPPVAPMLARENALMAEFGCSREVARTAIEEGRA